uniref:Uncharacterized protein n=1 Tax=Setaria viridis TaxID=4556 RepID=A0A4U6VV49_SETVI|nr:hypothetical protein SEVIR_2G264750v2 [Setaria viridis]
MKNSSIPLPTAHLPPLFGCSAAAQPTRASAPPPDAGQATTPPRRASWLPSPAPFRLRRAAPLRIFGCSLIVNSNRLNQFGHRIYCLAPLGHLATMLQTS